MNIIKKVVSLPHTVGTFIPAFLTPFIVRIAIFFVFWNSAQSRLYEWKFLGYSWKFWEISETSFYLFDEFSIPLLSTELSTYMATFTEFFLSLFILLGVFTRCSALGLLGLVLIIQIFAMPGSWAVHLLWSSSLIYILKEGAGPVSIDKLLKEPLINPK